MVDVYLVGVGGQGIITASKIIGEAAILAGENVILSETHGMAQRGGSVVCTARIGDVSGPLIPDGAVDVILSFELLETLRTLCKASKKTMIIASTERMVPLSVSTQKLRYPSRDEAEESLREVSSRVLLVDSREMAEEAGVPMSSNVVMVGALAGAGVPGIDRVNFEEALERSIPRKVEENKKAFSYGYEAGAKTVG